MHIMEKRTGIAIFLSALAKEADQDVHEEHQISAAIEARLGQLSIELFREQVRNGILTEKNDKLHEDVEHLRQEAAKTQEMNKTITTTVNNLTTLLGEIIAEMSGGRLPLQSVVVQAFSFAQQPNAHGPFLIPQNRCHELKKGAEAIRRLDQILNFQRDYDYPGDKFISASMVFEFLEQLVNMGHADDSYDRLKVMFANAKSATDIGQTRGQGRGVKAGKKRKKAKR